jgi:hypothetical protein
VVAEKNLAKGQGRRGRRTGAPSAAHEEFARPRAARPRDKLDDTGDNRGLSLALRPKWSVEFAMPSRDAVACLAAQLEGGALLFRRSRIPGGGVERGPRDRDHFQLSVRPAAQRVWTPWLDIDVEPRDAGTHVFARFGPHPSVWTGFAFAYLTLAVGFVVALVVAGSGTLVRGGGQPWALWLAAILAALAGGLWGLAQLGQRLGRDQVQAIRAEFDRALAACRDQA